MSNKSTHIHGVASSGAIDTAGEIVDIAGLDCSSLVGGALNWEHLATSPDQICGKVLEYKKIFSEADCETDAHRMFWHKCQVPFLYIIGRLFDDKKESAKEAAALFLDDAEHPHEQPMLGFSVEGSKISKEGMTITRSIARKVSLTNLPANKTCVAQLMKSPSDKFPKNSIDSLFKGEVQFFTPNAKYLEFLAKKEYAQKDVGGQADNNELKKSAPKWSGGKVSGDSVHFSHPEHGTVSIHKQPGGEFHVKHQGQLAGLDGVKGSFKTAGEAGQHAKNYMGAVGNRKIMAPAMHDRSSPQMPKMTKALEAGSGMGAPSTLTQGAALGKESLNGKIKKSKWLSRAKEAYGSWEKREAFESFMKSRMPHLSKGEIKAIGQTLALKKSVNFEKSLGSLVSFGKHEKIPTSQNECNEKIEKALGEEFVHEGYKFKEIQHPETPKGHKAFHVKEPSGKEDVHFAPSHEAMSQQVGLMANRDAKLKKV